VGNRVDTKSQTHANSGITAVVVGITVAEKFSPSPALGGEILPRDPLQICHRARRSIIFEMRRATNVED
jgi:hypothetical protein